MCGNSCSTGTTYEHDDLHPLEIKDWDEPEPLRQNWWDNWCLDAETDERVFHLKESTGAHQLLSAGFAGHPIRAPPGA